MRIYLGGYPAAGKTTLAGWLKTEGWHHLDFDLTSPDSRVDDLLDAPADHPDFNHPRVIAEGGFLEEAPRFAAMFDRVGFFPVWLTGSRERLHAARVVRKDDPEHVRNDWISLVNKHCRQIQWALEVDMWRPDGVRKTGPEVMEEILTTIKEMG